MFSSRRLPGAADDDDVRSWLMLTNIDVILKLPSQLHYVICSFLYMTTFQVGPKRKSSFSYEKTRLWKDGWDGHHNQALESRPVESKNTPCSELSHISWWPTSYLRLQKVYKTMPSLVITQIFIHFLPSWPMRTVTTGFIFIIINL